MNVFTYILATCDEDVRDDLALSHQIAECHIDAALHEGYDVLRDGLAGFNAYVAWRDMLTPGIHLRYRRCRGCNYDHNGRFTHDEHVCDSCVIADSVELEHQRSRCQSQDELIDLNRSWVPFYDDIPF